MRVFMDFTQLQTPKDLDIVSDVQFSNWQDQFLVSSWDNKVLLYDCSYPDTPQLLNQFTSQTPVLALAYLKGNNAFTGCLDGTICLVDYENGRLVPEKFITPGNQINGGINNLCTFNDSLLITSSFDKHINIIDPRSPVPVYQQRKTKKIFKMDTTSNFLTMGMSERTVEIYDHRNWQVPYQTRESGLKLQIHDLKSFPNEEGFAIASIDGRVSIEYFDPSPEVQDLKYAFKCHRQFDKLTQTDIVYPVNSIAFNKTTNHLYTAGSDGVLNIWNWQSRRKIKQLPQFKNECVESIRKLALNKSQLILVVATSDDSFKNAASLEHTSGNLRFSSGLYVRRL